ncbi:uncharacterized protein LOC143599096 [Bidens hawaiensis]|uniref:uncharacterized protein LOC143599096 n=1 Tax=Bidens hawaiensis TaxID=980011 RepID=UPI0040499220
MARLEAIRIFLAYVPVMGFTVYQMDVKTTLLYGEVEEEIYVDHPPRFKDPKHPTHVYMLDKAWGKYVEDMLVKIEMQDSKIVTTPMSETAAQLGSRRKTRRPDIISIMIGSLMYLIASQSDIMFAICERKSAFIRCKILGNMLISWQC